MTARYTSPSIQECMKFLQDVASGRRTAQARFADWFPDFSKGDLRKVVAYMSGRVSLPYWQHPDVSPFAPSTNDRDTYEHMLRHRLRIIWHRADSADNPRAAVQRLRSETREFQHLLYKVRPGFESKPDWTVWMLKTVDALNWLERNTHKLRLCGIKNCRVSPYFIVSRSHKTYCSTTCQELAEVERIIEREAAMKKAVVKPRLSSEGRERISVAAKARWKKYRANKKRERKTQNFRE